MTRPKPDPFLGFLDRLLGGFSSPEKRVGWRKILSRRQSVSGMRHGTDAQSMGILGKLKRLHRLGQFRVSTKEAQKEGPKQEMVGEDSEFKSPVPITKRYRRRQTEVQDLKRVERKVAPKKEDLEEKPVEEVLKDSKKIKKK